MNMPRATGTNRTAYAPAHPTTRTTVGMTQPPVSRRAAPCACLRASHRPRARRSPDGGCRAEGGLSGPAPSRANRWRREGTSESRTYSPALGPSPTSSWPTSVAPAGASITNPAWWPRPTRPDRIVLPATMPNGFPSRSPQARRGTCRRSECSAAPTGPRKLGPRCLLIEVLGCRAGAYRVGARRRGCGGHQQPGERAGDDGQRGDPDRGGARV
jgi:hypothetical protein